MNRSEMDEPRILTDDESAWRRSEQAAGAPGRAIELCLNWLATQQLTRMGIELPRGDQ